ncbi:MAG TPA: DUF362 domain-containing protein [Spirochaetes bacterium]|nr:DUF362 domain-containing protein [Spirochaetota bacterium]
MTDGAKNGPSSLVSVLRCGEYSSSLLVPAVRRCLEHVGFDPASFKNARVAVKPNLLRATVPERAVVTHPEFFKAVVSVIKSEGGTPFVVESPGFESPAKVLEKAAYLDFIRDEKIELWDNHSTRVLHNEEGEKFKRFEVASMVFDADIIVNLPKMKTHSLTVMTGAVKNLFGTIPGLEKSKWHMRARDREQFAGFLLDLYGTFLRGFNPPKKIIHIMDGVLAMEGDGPGPRGTPRKAGYIIAGLDAIAVDTVMAAIAGFKPGTIPLIDMGGRRGLGAGAMGKIDIRGDGIADGLSPFKAPDMAGNTSALSRVLNGSFMKNMLVERPVPSAERCTLCYQCRRICPAGAITPARDGEQVPRYDYGRCIRCYCCMEICPEAAIGLKKGTLQWLLNMV